jgi:TPR repeat protein
VSLGRQVVIKENLPVQFCFRDPRSLTVSPRHTSGEDLDNFQWSLENFSRESAMLASLDHPGIVRVHRSFQAFGTAYFVMPYVEGVALDELAKQRAGTPFTEKELRDLLEEMLAALGYLHDRGIYHRDIKPGNILITDQGKPVLIDFGSARQRLSERSMTVVESAGYTPFEQLQTRGNVGPWSDLYALAATLVKVMTGEAPPKANDRSFGDPWQPLAFRQELLGRYSARFLECLDRALRLPIQERWQNSEQWKMGLSQGEIAPLAKNDVSAITASTTTKKSRRNLISAMAATMMIACGVAWWNVRDPAPGALVIMSDPAGAEVLDDSGKNLGKSPMELKGLPGGKSWNGQLELEGYSNAPIRADVQSGDTTMVPLVKLQATPQKVVVTSEPSGAKVMQGGVQVGETPWESPAIAPGSRVEYVLRKEGYEERSLSGAVALGCPLELKVQMVPDAFYAERLKESDLAAYAERGNAYAQALLGIRMYFGPHEGMTDVVREQSKKVGLDWLQKSATRKHPLGLAARGSAEFGELKNSEAAEQFAKLKYEESVKAGLLENLEIRPAPWIFYAGIAYYKGRGVSKNLEEAVKWFRKAAEQGGAEAQCSLGVCYTTGEGVAKDTTEAVKWYRKAAEQEYARAQFNLGLCYAKGEGVAKDSTEAVKWYRKAAEQGGAEAQYNLGVCYATGEGVAKDSTEAVKWYRKAAEQGDARAQYSLGFCYANGEGVAKDTTEAVKWCRKAAEQGDALAQYSLGFCYANGEGVAKDSTEAVKWFRKAAEQGGAEAQYNLGVCYATGEGIAKDTTEAVKWYRKAAEQGDARAQFSLGVCYANGEGVAKDSTEAVKWFRKAAEQGDADAQFNLGLCYAKGEGVAKDSTEAVKWYRKAAEQGDARAQYSLGFCYANGEGVAKDSTEAVKWLRKVLKSGDEEATKFATQLLKQLGY